MAAEALRDLRDFGVKIYLDDFGTGYSSLSHLHKLPVDALKIDRSFVRSLLLPERPAIVESILALARTLNTGVVAEGVESDLQAQELKRLGCRHAQGYFFSPPLSSPRVEQMLGVAPATWPEAGRDRPRAPRRLDETSDRSSAPRSSGQRRLRQRRDGPEVAGGRVSSDFINMDPLTGSCPSTARPRTPCVIGKLAEVAPASAL